MHFYTNVVQFGNRILVRGIRDGKRYTSREAFGPSLFVTTTEPSPYKDLYGNSLGRVDFEDINAAKDFNNSYKGADNFEVFGQTGYNYQYITENFPGTVEFNADWMAMYSMDIETETEEGFPNIANPTEEVNLITVQNMRTKAKITWGAGPFDVSKIKHINMAQPYEYVECKSEKEMFAKFLKWWSKEQPDVVTGWNIQLFDIPYLVMRMSRVLGEDEVAILSPWKRVSQRTITVMGREHIAFDILGVAVLDYLDLYKKFTYKAQENYKLDTIAKAELKREKLTHDYDTFKDFYSNDWQRFVEYNVIDVEIVDALEDKMRLVELVLTMAYDAKCNYNDIFSPVRTWDAIIYNFLWDKKIIIPQNKESTDRKIEGAFVKEPVPAMYDWVVSFDATSLYPSIMMQYNMSPETIRFGVDVTVATLLEGKHREVTEVLVEQDLCMASNGFTFDRSFQGAFSEIVEKVFGERQMYKKKQLVAKQEYERTHDPEQDRLARRYGLIQEARKIQMNSLYGAMANKYFRFYDDRIAEGITMSGQFILQTVIRALNEFLNKVCGTVDVDYAFYGDTDSVYITLSNLVKKFFLGKTKEEVVNLLDKICQEKITDAINKACEDIAVLTNAYKRKITFKREAIADRGIWTAKKKYALNVYDNEGVRYAEPDQKVLGLEVVRSSTPAVIRVMLKEGIKLILTATEKDVQAFIAAQEVIFRKMTVEQIAFPRGCNGLDKYGSRVSIYLKGTPMHVRGALLYNQRIRDLGLDKRYEFIREGDKIRFVYLKEPNTLRENVIAFPSSLPPELDLHRYIDYTMMWEKSFVEPLRSIMDSTNWNVRPVATLEDLFT